MEEECYICQIVRVDIGPNMVRDIAFWEFIYNYNKKVLDKDIGYL
jgi:hypothetical protein